MPTPAQWGYLAGMIDGEGSLGLTLLRARRLHPTWFYYEPRLSICGTAKPAMEGIASDFNGHISISNNNRGYGGNGAKKLYRVGWQAQSVVADILRNTIPYLRIKGKQAELLLEYCESRLNRPTHKATLSEREGEICFLIKEENHK